MNESDANLDGDTAATFGRTWVDRRPWEFLSELTAIGNRMGGTEGERRAADLVADVLGEAGVRDLRRQEFDLQRWSRGRTELTLVDPVEREFEAIALPYAPAATVTAPLVDVGHGTPDEIAGADVEGAVALASTNSPSGGRFVHRLEKFSAAVAAGADGFVFANHKPGQLPPTGALAFDGGARAPAVGVSKETGDRLREYAAESESAGDGDRGGSTRPGGTDAAGRVRLSVEATTAPGTSRNVLGRLGPETEEELVLIAHYDAHDVGEGALDNGCGTTILATTARILAGMDLERGVRIAAVGCEELGLIGSERLAESLPLAEVAGVVNVDGAGRARDLVAMSHDSDATAAAAERVGERTDHPIRVDEEPHPFSDQWPFVRRGIPALQLHSRTGERGRGWTHTAADTRDKVDPRDLREHAMLAALLVRELAGTELPRLDRERLADAFREADFEAGMRAADLWPEAWV